MKDQIDGNLGGHSDRDLFVTREDLHGVRPQFIKYMVIADLNIDLVFHIAVRPD